MFMILFMLMIMKKTPPWVGRLPMLRLVRFRPNWNLAAKLQAGDDDVDDDDDDDEQDPYHQYHHKLPLMMIIIMIMLTYVDYPC